MVFSCFRFRLAPLKSMCAVGLMLSLLPHSSLAEEENESVLGEVYAHGVLVEGACDLDLTSTYQEVDLGQNTSLELKKIGSSTPPVPFEIKFKHCIRTRSNVVDRHTGNTTWSADQPVVTVTFYAEKNPENPELVDVMSDTVTGIGLRILDQEGRDIRLGERSEALFLTKSTETLTYYTSLERTTAPLNLGEYRAVTHFRVSYY